jgi:type I restriction enzyme S subunit
VSEVIEEIDEADELAPLHAQIAAALPASWTLETLGSLCEKSQYGWTTKADKAGSGVKFLRTTDITPGVVDWSSVPYCVETPSDLEKYLIKDGDILISRTGSIGVNYLVVKPEPAVFASYLIRFRPKTSISTKYLKYYLQSPAYWRAINTGKKGIAVQNVNATMLSRIPVPVAPPAVQDEIVAELEKQFSRLDEAVANLQRVKANLKRYKASVLKAAVEGRLVETEATLARHEARTYETGEQLLQRILEERRKESKGSAKPSDATSLVEMSSLPEGWVCTSLGECFRVAVGATPSRKETTYWNGDVPWVSSGEVQLGRIRHTKEHISAAGLANSSTQINPAGSVMIGMIGQGRTRGQAAILDIDAANNQNCAAIWVSRTDVPPEFVFSWLLSRYTETRSEGSGNNQQALNKRLVEQIPLPLPPLAEQVRIVAEVDRHLSIVSEVEAEVDANLRRAQSLRQATLSKAFQQTQ